MPRVIVSEKTLEINVIAELLQRIRSRMGFEAAFWIGMKQQQEARNGIDDLLTNVPRGWHLALQFKAPRARPRNGWPFYFPVNERQHAHLIRLASRRPGAVYYALPHFNTFQSLRSAAPNLLKGTYGLSVASVPWLSAGPHRIESIPPAAAIRSEFSPVTLRPLTEVVDEVLPVDSLVADAVSDSLITHEELRAWIEELFQLEREAALQTDIRSVGAAIGQRLRGFSTLCIPGD